MWDYSDGIKEQTEGRSNAALGDRPNLILMFHSGFFKVHGVYHKRWPFAHHNKLTQIPSKITSD